ncbi:MAG TPA: hypothetical protein VGD88_08920 [Opitutaceae bacterium]
MSLRLRQASHCLALLLLPALAPGFSRAMPRPRVNPGPDAAVQPRHLPQPYLRVVGAPPLRFAADAPPPDLVTRPPAAGTPPGLADNHETEPAPSLGNLDNSAPETASTTEVVDAMPVPSVQPADVAPASRMPSTPAPSGPAPILPDDTRPSLRPEDFLPFFQLPGTSGVSADVTVIAPVPRQAPAPPAQPPSSATYRQTP